MNESEDVAFGLFLQTLSSRGTSKGLLLTKSISKKVMLNSEFFGYELAF